MSKTTREVRETVTHQRPGVQCDERGCNEFVLSSPDGWDVVRGWLAVQRMDGSMSSSDTLHFCPLHASAVYQRIRGAP